MWGAIISAALAVGSSVASGISASNKRKAQRRALARQQAENRAWYDRNYNMDPTKRADAQRLLTQMNEAIKNRNKAARGRQAVMGGTEDSTTAVKESNSKAIADTISSIYANNESRKDRVEQQYFQRKSNLDNQQTQMEVEDAGNGAAIASSVMGTASNIAGALDGVGKSATASNGSVGSQAGVAKVAMPASFVSDMDSRMNSLKSGLTGGRVV